MHSTRSLLALLLLTLLLLVATAGPAGALNDDKRRVMVQLHNFYRAQVSPPAANMLQMRWDEELATFAKAYAQQCVWGHNKERGRRGENLFAITEEGIDVPLAVNEWYREQEHYNLSAATCTPGEMCGHYTQVVWAKTEKIGCGSHFCEKLQGVEETNIHLLVCNYEPPGNVKGQRPYQEGTPCSQCPSGYSCENSLCEPIRDPEEAQELPHLVTETPSSLATEASDSRKGSIFSTLATEAPSFLVTEVSGSLATKVLPAIETNSLATETPSLVTEVSDSLATKGIPAVETNSPATEIPPFLVTEVSGSLPTKSLPAIETKAPSSLSTEGPHSMATEAPPSLTSEAPWSLETLNLFFNEEPATSPKSTHKPIPESVDKEASKTTMPSKSLKNFLHHKVFLTGTQEPLPYSQGEGEAEAELPSSSEILASVFPVQDEAGEPQATLDYMGHPSKFLPNSPKTSATTNAMGGRTLALQLPLPGTEDPEKPQIQSGGNSGPGHIWGPLVGLLLLPPLVLAGTF